MKSWGTAYFITFEAAVRYYAAYEPGSSKEDVQRHVARKIVDSEIHIGEPPIKAGEYRRLGDGGCRYFIVEGQP